MAVSERQLSLKKKKRIFGLISFSIWIGTCIIMIILAIENCFPQPVTNGVSGEADGLLAVFSPEVKSAIVSLIVTVSIGLLGTILLKDKLRVFMWTACVIIAAFLYNRAGMFVIFGIWMVDEYIFRALYLYYKKKYEIRKEIDY